MNWNQNLKGLRDVFAFLYSSPSSARVVATAAGVNVLAINFNDALINIWHSLVEEAVKQNKLNALIVEVTVSYGENPDFIRAVSNWKNEPNDNGSDSMLILALPERTNLRKFIVANLQGEIDEFLMDFSGALKSKYGYDEVLTPAILGGNTFSQLALNLILFCERRGWYNDLVKAVRDARPHLKI